MNQGKRSGLTTPLAKILIISNNLMISLFRQAGHGKPSEDGSSRNGHPCQGVGGEGSGDRGMEDR